MAIDTEAIFQTADEMFARGEKVGVSSLQKALKQKYKSGGNRNKVSDGLAAWRKARGIPARKSQLKAPPRSTTVVVDNPNSFIDRLPAELRQLVIALVMAIHALIGTIRNEERNAATELVDNARQNLQQELESIRTENMALQGENQRLNTENNRLKHDAAERDNDAVIKAAHNLLSIATGFVQSGAATTTIDSALTAKTSAPEISRKNRTSKSAGANKS